MQRSADHRDLHSFPTRRSSDLLSLRVGGPAELLLERADGTRCSIHPLWLRERCKDATSIDARTQQRLQDPSLRSEEHTSELQSRVDLVCRLLLEKKKKKTHKTD